MLRTQMDENRKKFEEEARKRLEENKAKLQAQNQARMEILKKKQEEMQKKQEDLKKVQMEKFSAVKLRRAIVQFKGAIYTTQEKYTNELDECVKEEIPKLVTLKETIEKEVEAAREFVKAKWEKIEQKKKEDEEKMKHLAQLVEKLEAASNSIVEEAEPFTSEGKEMSLQEILSAEKAVGEAFSEFEAQSKACKAFMESNRFDDFTKFNIAKNGGESASTLEEDTTQLFLRLNSARYNANQAKWKAAESKEERLQKAKAKDVLDQQVAVFKKYDTDKDSMLSRRELAAFSRGEYKFVLPSDSVDFIFKVLVTDGGKGVKQTDLQRLTVMIGVAREKAMDDIRRDERLAKEKRLANMKVELERRIAEAVELVNGLQEEIGKVEKHLSTLPGQIKRPAAVAAKAAEMREAADETEGMIKTVTESLAGAKQTVKGLETDEAEEELKNLTTSAAQKLTTQLEALSSRVSWDTSALARYRSDISKTEMAELDVLWRKALAMLRQHRSAKKLKNDDIFAKMDADKDGKINESDFVKFFKSCEREKPEVTKNDGEEPDATISKEDLSRLFAFLDDEQTNSISKESFLSMIRHFMKVAKATVISDSLSIKESKTVRRLEPDDVVEVLQGPIVEDDLGIRRLFVKVVSDGKEGWLTPVGNQGTVFLKEGGGTMKVVKDTILTGSFLIGDKTDKKERKLKAGEIVDVREWGKKEPTLGLTRMKVRVQSDGDFGWVTSIGNTGIVFLEMA